MTDSPPPKLWVGEVNKLVTQGEGVLVGGFLVTSVDKLVAEFKVHNFRRIEVAHSHGHSL